MTQKTSFFSSSIGLKLVMAVTGVLLIGFLVAHLLGNLQIFLGQETFNAYAATLASMPELLWIARAGLLIAFFAHIISAIRLRKRNTNARPERYKYENTVQATTASRSMLRTGVLILVFVLYHLLHFTLGKVQPEYFHLVDAAGRHDVFSMVIHGFQNPIISLSYVILVLVVGLHLSHATQSFFQTIGFSHPRYTPMIEKLTPLFSWGIALLYISIPTAIYLGCIQLPSGVNN